MLAAVRSMLSREARSCCAADAQQGAPPATPVESVPAAPTGYRYFRYLAAGRFVCDRHRCRLLRAQQSRGNARRALGQVSSSRQSVDFRRARVVGGRLPKAVRCVSAIDRWCDHAERCGNAEAVVASLLERMNCALSQGSSNVTNGSPVRAPFCLTP
jgi:hypothetical protein